MNDSIAQQLVNVFADIATNLKTAVGGWKSFYLPAEPFINVFSFSLTASQVLDNQAVDLRLPYAYYVYGIGVSSTGLFSWNLRASGGGVFFGNAKMRSTLFWSANEPVLWLRRPFKIAPYSSLIIDLTELSVATNNGQIGFVGWKSASQYPPAQQVPNSMQPA